MGGCTDLLLGRRGAFCKCQYWERDNNVKDLSEYQYKKTPKGTFYADRVSNKTKQKQEINNQFMFDASNVTISTKGKVDIKPKDIVLFENSLWQVTNVQEIEIRSQEQFMTRLSKITYISLRK